ncbi:type IX secretion system plug protein domain-containing protein [Flexithrix dorotheae]|uniref:type IX secretion system plug protein n=1 Tax=Flexithrix dorotheae TaxID=70993 RepID=UPI00037020A3|nr:type IX secretion system plug protein domain-containing protein [Flexithrix dorotheae]
MILRFNLLLFTLFITIQFSQGQDLYDVLEKPVEKTLIYDDFVYENYIRSVVLYPRIALSGDKLIPAIVPISNISSLVLEFDDITDDTDDYKVKLIHCNFDWSPSQYNSAEYLFQYNEFNILNFEYSLNTKLPYVHYMFQLPQVKKSGNYLLVVYRGTDDKDLILSKRFIVYEDFVGVGITVEEYVGGAEARRFQQVKFNVSYGNFPLEMPQENVKVVLRQNYRWDNAITDLKPLFVKEFQKVLDYQYFNEENTFEGLNEFRFFDFSFNFSGFGVKTVLRNPQINKVQLYPEKTRKGFVYNSQNVNPDYNGRFFTINRETGRGGTEGDYAFVNFTMLSDEVPGKQVYVIGGFNNYQLTDENRLEYSRGLGGYTGNILLKQGRYDYMYTLLDPKSKARNEVYFEGSHSQTENEYDVIVYYRGYGSRGDRVVGYHSYNFMR